MNENPNNSIHDNILKAIETGKVTMKPRWHFVVRASLLIVGIILVSLSLVYLASFIVFILRQTGVLFVPEFGLHGINVFLMATPWLLVLIALVFIALLQILIKKYSFGYGRPLMYSAIGIMVLVVLAGYLVERTSLHQRLFRQAENQNLPFAGGLYRQFGERRPDNITAGVITEILENGYKINSHNEEIVVIVVTPETKLPPQTSFNVGDMIVALGKREADKVIAEGIRMFDGEMLPRHPGSPPPGMMSPQ